MCSPAGKKPRNWFIKILQITAVQEHRPGNTDCPTADAQQGGIASARQPTATDN